MTAANYEKNTNATGSVIAVLIGIVAIGLILVYQGFVTSVLWNWFMPVLFKLPTLSIAGAIGMATVIQVFTTRFTDYKDTKTQYKALAYELYAPLILLVIGFIVHGFVH